MVFSTASFSENPFNSMLWGHGNGRFINIWHKDFLVKYLVTLIRACICVYKLLQSLQSLFLLLNQTQLLPQQCSAWTCF